MHNSGQQKETPQLVTAEAWIAGWSGESGHEAWTHLKPNPIDNSILLAGAFASELTAGNGIDSGYRGTAEPQRGRTLERAGVLVMPAESLGTVEAAHSRSLGPWLRNSPASEMSDLASRHARLSGAVLCLGLGI